MATHTTLFCLPGLLLLLGFGCGDDDAGPAASASASSGASSGSGHAGSGGAMEGGAGGADVEGGAGGADAEGGAGGADAEGGAGGADAEGGAGGAAQGGGGDSGGSGGTGTVCTPGSTESCYSGPSGTLGVGICAPGLATCEPDGSALGPCTGDVVPAQETCAVWGDEDCDGTTNEACPVTGCTKSFASAVTDLNSVAGVAVDATGHVVVVGSFTGTLDLGGGPLVASGLSAYVARYDSSCNHLWSKSFVASQYVVGRAVAVDPIGNIFVTGGFKDTASFGGGPISAVGDSDAYLVKLAPDGSHEWSKRFGDSGFDQFGLDVAARADGAVAVTGQMYGSHDFGGGVVSGVWFAAAFAPDGSHLWSLATDGARGGSVAFDDAGNAILGGALFGTANLGTGPVTNVPPGENPIVAKLSATGAPLWVKSFVGSTQWFFVDVAVSGGDPVVTGSFGDSLDVGGVVLTSADGGGGFVAKLAAADGATHWAKSFGDGGALSITSAATHASGDVVVAGTFDGVEDFGGGPLDALGNAWVPFLARFSPAGSHVQSASYLGNFSQDVRVATGPAGEQVLGGELTGGSVDFGVGTPVDEGGFFVRFVP